MITGIRQRGHAWQAAEVRLGKAHRRSAVVGGRMSEASAARPLPNIDEKMKELLPAADRYARVWKSYYRFRSVARWVTVGGLVCIVSGYKPVQIAGACVLMLAAASRLLARHLAMVQGGSRRPELVQKFGACEPELLPLVCLYNDLFRLEKAMNAALLRGRTLREESPSVAEGLRQAKIFFGGIYVHRRFDRRQASNLKEYLSGILAAPPPCV